MDAVLLHGVGEGAHDVLLPDHLPEALGAVAAIERRGFGHESSLSPALGCPARRRGAIAETPVSAADPEVRDEVFGTWA